MTFAATGVVGAVKLAVVELAATVTETGTCAAGSLLVRATTSPPAGAGPLRVTLPVEALPPTTDVGFIDNETRDGGLTVIEAPELELP